MSRHFIVYDILSLWSDTKVVYNRSSKIKFSALIQFVKEALGNGTIAEIVNGKSTGGAGRAYLSIDKKNDAYKFVSRLVSCDLQIDKKLYKSEVTGYQSRKVDITIDALAGIDDYDVLVLITGDSDLASLTDFLREKGAKKVVLVCHNSAKRALGIDADGIIHIPKECVFEENYNSPDAVSSD